MWGLLDALLPIGPPKPDWWGVEEPTERVRLLVEDMKKMPGYAWDRLLVGVDALRRERMVVGEPRVFMQGESENLPETALLTDIPAVKARYGICIFGLRYKLRWQAMYWQQEFPRCPGISRYYDEVKVRGTLYGAWSPAPTGEEQAEWLKLLTEEARELWQTEDRTLRAILNERGYRT